MIIWTTPLLIMGLYKNHIEGKNISCFKFDIFLRWKMLKGLDLHKIEPLFLGISVGGNLVLSISQRLFSGSLPLMKPCISIEGKRKHCLLTHLQSWAKWLVNQTSTTVLVWFFLGHVGHSGEYGNAAKLVGKMSKSVMWLISIHFWNWF